MIGGLAVSVGAVGALGKARTAAPRTDLWSNYTFDALVALTVVGVVMFLLGVLDLVPHRGSLRSAVWKTRALVWYANEYLHGRRPTPPTDEEMREVARSLMTTLAESQAPPADAASDATAIIRPLLRKVRAELVTHRDELNRVMVRNRTEGLLNVFWAGTNDVREQIAAFDTKPVVYPAISDAYDEVIRYAGEIDASRIGGGPIYETDGIERTAVAVYAAIIRIDSWEATN